MMKNQLINIAIAQLGKEFKSSIAFIMFVIKNSKQITYSISWTDIISEVTILKTIEEVSHGDLILWGSKNNPYSVAIYIGGGFFITTNVDKNLVEIQSINKNWAPDFIGKI